MKIAAAYVRVSTEEQTELSPDSQVKLIREYAKKNGFIVPKEFIFHDDGISGRSTAKRQGFNQMIGTAKLKPKPFDAILLWKFSRFARNREDSIVYKSMLHKLGIDVISISENVGDDKMSVLIEAMIEAMDEYYSINLAEEVRRGMQEKFSRGGVVSQPPYGYRMGDNVFVIQPDEAEIVRKIYHDFLSGAGRREIAVELNALGVVTRKGRPFDNRRVEYILSNPVYTGMLRRSKNGRQSSGDPFNQREDMQVIPGNHEPIIDRETFDATQKRLKEAKRLYVKHAHTEGRPFMLKGVVRCSNCGSTLVMAMRNTSLQCHMYAKGQCDVSHAISIAKANTAVLERIKEDLRLGAVGVNVENQHKKKKPTVDATSMLLQKEKQKLERIKEAYAAGVDTLQEYREQKQKITARIEELSKSTTVEYHTPEQVSREIVKRIQASLEMLEDAAVSEELKNQAMRALVEKIIFNRKKNLFEIVYRDPFA
mgnify:CR=1 FL=1